MIKLVKKEELKGETMSKKENIPQGEYTGHLVHFTNQADNVFTFIIDEAENIRLIGKGVSQRVDIDRSNDVSSQ